MQDPMTEHNQTNPGPDMEAGHALSAQRLNDTRSIETLDELNTHPGSQGGIVLVRGPAGAGKTTLIKRIAETTLKRAHSQTNTKACAIPAIYVVAPSAGGNAFSWQRFYQLILAQLDDKLAAHPQGAKGYSLAVLRTAVERSLRERHVRLLIIDEAANIVRQTRNKHQLALQFEALKSLASQCGIQLVWSAPTTCIKWCRLQHSSHARRT